MSYQHMDHAEWMQRHIDATRRNGRKLKRPPPEKLSEFQARVVDIVGMVGGGIYNAPISYDSIDWDYGRGVSMTWQGDLSTFDFDRLTMLVFLCHEARIRCDVSPCNGRYLRLSFWERKDAGDMAVRHPSLNEAVAKFREYLPDGHRIIYRSAVEGAA